MKDYLNDYDIDEYNYYVGTKKEGYIKLNKIINEEEKEEILNKYSELGLDVSIDEISTMVSENLTKNAIYSLFISFVAIIIYIAIRFSFSFGISGLLALVHDVILILVTFIIFNIQFNFIIIAALLTIIGYSINDTIVIFDKIRSSKSKMNNKDNVKSLLNESLNRILMRNIMTSVTTAFAIISLVIMRVNDIFTFNLAIIIGVVVGTISSLIFAPNLWMLLEIKNLNKPKKEIKKELDEMSIKGINS